MASRRDEIVAAALDLLGGLPVDRLTTRAIAERVGVSQPALFRHFASREEILRAVVLGVLAKLRDELHGLIQSGARPHEAARELARALFTFARDFPGIPALFFHEAARGGDDEVGAALRHLVSVPTAFVAELVRAARHDGELPRGVDADAAAGLFVALLQGLLLQARQHGRPLDPVESAHRVTDFWWAALRAGEPAGPDGEEGPGAPTDRLVALDARPIIARGEDPLATVLATLARLRSDGALLLLAPFRPDPLVTLVASRGWRAEPRPIGDGGWSVEFRGADCPEVEDLTELEAPLPMERVLLRVSALPPGEAALFRLPRYPEPLLARLEERGLRHDAVSAPDGVTLLWVTTPETST